MGPLLLSLLSGAGATGAGTALNFGNILGALGSMNQGSSGGLNFNQPPENMRGGLTPFPSDTSSIPAMDIAESNKKEPKEAPGGLFSKGFWEDYFEQSQKDWREKGPVIPDMASAGLKVSAPSLGEMPNAMSYVSRNNNANRSKRDFSPDYINGYLKGLLG